MLALDRLPEWWVFESVEYTSEVHSPEDKYRTGATALGTPPGGPQDNCHFEVKYSLEHEKLTYRMWERWLRRTLGGSLTYILDPIDGGTELTLVCVLEIPWGILLKFLEPFMLMYCRRVFEETLESLKIVMEK